MNVPCSGGSKPPPYGANRRTNRAVGIGFSIPLPT